MWLSSCCSGEGGWRDTAAAAPGGWLPAPGICAPLGACGRRRVACKCKRQHNNTAAKPGFMCCNGCSPIHPGLCVTMLCLHPFACLVCRMKFKRFGRPERPFNSSLEMVSASLPARSCLLCLFVCVSAPPVGVSNARADGFVCLICFAPCRLSTLPDVRLCCVCVCALHDRRAATGQRRQCSGFSVPGPRAGSRHPSIQHPHADGRDQPPHRRRRRRPSSSRCTQQPAAALHAVV